MNVENVHISPSIVYSLSLVQDFEISGSSDMDNASEFKSEEEKNYLSEKIRFDLNIASEKKDFSEKYSCTSYYFYKSRLISKCWSCI